MNGVELIQGERKLHVGVVAKREHLSGLPQRLQPQRFGKVSVDISVTIAEIINEIDLRSKIKKLHHFNHTLIKRGLIFKSNYEIIYAN